MVFLRTPAQTHNNALKRSAFLRSREREKEVSLSLSLSLFCSCRCCCCSNASRVVRFESEEEGEKKNDSEKFFLRAREKAQIYCTQFSIFSLSLSFSFSPVVVVVVACHHPERERERGARISSKTLPVSRFAKHTCVCSLSVLLSALNIFILFLHAEKSG